MTFAVVASVTWTNSALDWTNSSFDWSDTAVNGPDSSYDATTGAASGAAYLPRSRIA